MDDAAAIERRKDVRGTPGDFYESVVVEALRASDLDHWLASLPDKADNPWIELASVIHVHKRLMDVFREMTGLEKRSLASKYLHFHRPDLFYIYDSRVKNAVRAVVPRVNQIANIATKGQDWEYHGYCRRAQWMTDHIDARFGKRLTPRQVDVLLLNVAERIRSSGSARTNTPPKESQQS